MFASVAYSAVLLELIICIQSIYHSLQYMYDVLYNGQLHYVLSSSSFLSHIDCFSQCEIMDCLLVLSDTLNTSILIVDTYVMIPVLPRSRYTVVCRSSTKYRETAQVSRVSTIPCSSYHLAMCTLQACDAETNSKVAENHNYHSTIMSARARQAAVNKFHIFALAQHSDYTHKTAHL